MLDKFKRYLIGKPLKNEALGKEKYSVLWGLPILASDAISSVAYASEEILIVLVPAIGILAYRQLTVVSAAIIGLLILLTFSYRQTIDNYPNGGGAYIVAKDNLGEIAGVTAGAALSIDYIMTVAVSISSGVAQITSSIPPLIPYTVPLCVLTVILLMLGNLRGIRESSKLFSLPAYAFVFAILTMLIVGVFKYISGVPNPQPDPSQLQALEPVSLILLLRAFSSGCTALTGVEAVSNAVPNFREPTTKHAKTVLLLLSLLVFTLFGGISILVNLFHVIPGEKTVLAQIAYEIFGNTFMFYFVTISTFVILSMAANTSYADFPQLVSVMAREGHAPRQLSMRGDRLSFSNGIISLSVIAIILIVVFQAKVTSLIGLYAVGVFISFTLSQIGMCTKWVRQRGKNWVPKALINGFGGLVQELQL
jgi:amino acid transporter